MVRHRPAGSGTWRPPGAVRRRAATAPTTIGGILAGFDEQVWRRQPPAQERVARVDRAGAIATPGGLTITLPEQVDR
ncbi:MAG TPA: hypothetical protein VLA23_03220 [Candidatus Limnocylindrales bacterium]|nr:hypothetical protein [Candidatus Limnocylindrales bacterium]